MKKVVTILSRRTAPALLSLLAGLFVVVPAFGQITMWSEDFSDVSDWSTFQTTITSDGAVGTITTDANNWGKAEPIAWTEAEFGCGLHSDELTVVATNVYGRLQVNIMEEVPPYTEINLITTQTSGTFTADVSAITGWVGLKSFKIVCWVDWQAPASVSLDEISLVNTGGWADDFDPADPSWRDDNTNPGFNAVFTDIAGPYARVQEVPNVAWGKVLSPVLTIDVDAAPTLTAVVQSDATLSNFVFGIQEEEGAYQYFELGRGYDAGVFVYDYKAITGWSGTHTFSIMLGVESGDVDGWVVFDSVKLDCSDAPPPPTATENTSWGSVKSLFR